MPAIQKKPEEVLLTEVNGPDKIALFDKKDKN